ncbi:hypothetical protein E0485_23955 [Paenibacillus albiflavus]|uniref:Phospholipase C/D domain-containing protein n=1 Tax=Paenibacillus albiflavus TaxID=2545760 RepID=A0A4R4DXC9_9BACL|nr:hypothetical protein [Paenibacillus albiflavus]TCZ69298.1 hypothetical protein E0485_23955 [Paenibacillus albiflavus]
MPWPMIHFAIANRYHHNQPKPAYLLGCVAPDAVLVRKDVQEGKEKSHLGRNPSIDEFLAFLNANVDVGRFPDDHIDFFLGYIAHIYVDLAWSKLKNIISNNDRNFRNRLWQEENQMEFYMYRNEQITKQLVKDIMISPLYEVQGIFDKSELDIWRKSIFEWLGREENEPKILNKYITSTVVEEFIEQMTEDLKGLDQTLLKEINEGRNIS